MKNLLTTFFLWSSCALALAQSTPRTEQYCEFTLAGAFGSGGKCSIRFDDGQDRFVGLLNIPDKLRDENGEIILFNSAVDALNYLNGYGWELFTIRNDSSDTYYVMRRKIQKRAVDSTAPSQDDY